MHRLSVKICGICSLADALYCADLGASHIGLIFAAASARRIADAVACEIVSSLGDRVNIIGVFQDQDRESIMMTRKRIGLTQIQLHGTEPVEEVTALAPAIKAISSIDAHCSYADYESAAEMLIFDRAKGSSRTTAEWMAELKSQFRRRAPVCPFMVAGGIEPSLAVSVVQAFEEFETFRGIDIASGVESKAGIKDVQKLQALFKALKGETGYAISR